MAAEEEQKRKEQEALMRQIQGRQKKRKRKPQVGAAPRKTNLICLMRAMLVRHEES